MSLFSKIVKGAKRFISSAASNPVIGTAIPLAVPGLGGIAASAITSRLPSFLQGSITNKIVGNVTSRIFDRSPAQAAGIAMPGVGGLPSPTNQRRGILSRGRTPAPQPQVLAQPRGRTFGRNIGGSSLVARSPTFTPGRGSTSNFPSGDQIFTPSGGRTGPVGARGTTAMAALPLLSGIIRSTTGKIIAIVSPEGRRFTRKQVVGFAKKFGPEAAAAALGVATVEVLTAILDDSQSRPRRQRGITPRDLRVARNTICKIKRFNAMLGQTRAPVRRKKTCP